MVDSSMLGHERGGRPAGGGGGRSIRGGMWNVSRSCGASGSISWNCLLSQMTMAKICSSGTCRPRVPSRKLRFWWKAILSDSTQWRGQEAVFFKKIKNKLARALPYHAKTSLKFRSSKSFWHSVTRWWQKNRQKPETPNSNRHGRFCIMASTWCSAVARGFWNQIRTCAIANAHHLA